MPDGKGLNLLYLKYFLSSRIFGVEGRRERKRNYRELERACKLQALPPCPHCYSLASAAELELRKPLVNVGTILDTDQ